MEDSLWATERVNSLISSYPLNDAGTQTTGRHSRPVNAEKEQSASALSVEKTHSIKHYIFYYTTRTIRGRGELPITGLYIFVWFVDDDIPLINGVFG